LLGDRRVVILGAVSGKVAGFRLSPSLFRLSPHPEASLTESEP
jgi:hypothetical protein